MINILVIETEIEAMQRLANILKAVYETVDISYASTINEAKNLYWHEKFQLALIEVYNLKDNDLNLIYSLREITQNIIVFTVSDENQSIFHAFSNGVDGYILKQQNDSEIVKLLTLMDFGIPPLSPEITKKILLRLRGNSNIKITNCLSKQENNVLTLLAKGYSRKEIARLMGISINTVSAYTKSTYKKLNISNCSEATLEAVRLGLVVVD